MPMYMEHSEKQDGSQKVGLDELPSSSDTDFWAEAEIHTNLVPEQKKEEKHYFVRTTGRQAQCQNCDWGFELDPGDRIENGHLYTREGKLVI